jgi:uncharacterized protein with PIN domain
MLGGLARWLRAAGYDAAFEHGIDDGELVRRSHATGRILLSSDGPLFARSIVAGGIVKALFVPRGSAIADQLKFVLTTFRLERRDPRCMACGGELVEVETAAVAGEVPDKTRQCCHRFWRCRACQKLYWRGTHWIKIERALEVCLLP